MPFRRVSQQPMIERRRRQFVVTFSRVMAALAIVVAILHLWRGSWGLAAVGAASGAAALGVGQLAGIGRLYRPMAWVSAAVLFAVGVAAVHATLGLSSSAVAWLALVPLYAFCADGLRLGLASTIAAAGAMAGLFVVHGVPEVMPPLDSVRRFVNAGLATLFAGTLGWMFTRVQDALAYDLMAAQDRARSARQAKSRLLASCSHDLRTPLNAVLGYSDLLLEDARADGRNTDVSDLARLQTAARALLERIDVVLELARVEAGRAPMVPQTLTLGALTGHLSRAIPEGIHALVVCAPTVSDTVVQVDPAWMARVIQIGSVLYTHPGGPGLEVHVGLLAGDLRVALRSEGEVPEHTTVERQFRARLLTLLVSEMATHVEGAARFTVDGLTIRVPTVGASVPTAA